MKLQRRRADAVDICRIRKIHRRRDRQVGQGDQVRKYQGGV